MLAKRKPQPPSAEEREQALLAEIKAVRAKIRDFLEEKTEALHQTRDFCGLPMEIARRHLHQYQCACRCVARLLGEYDE